MMIFILLILTIWLLPLILQVVLWLAGAAFLMAVLVALFGLLRGPR